MDQYNGLTPAELIDLLLRRDIALIELQGKYDGLKTHFEALKVHHRETIDLHTNLLKRVTSIVSG